MRLRGSEFPDDTSQMLFILSYMKGAATRTWATYKIRQVLQPTKTLLTFGEFKGKADSIFTDPNREATQHGRNSQPCDKVPTQLTS